MRFLDIIYLSAAIIIGCLSCNEKNSKKTGLEGKVMPQFAIQLLDSTTIFSSQKLIPDKPTIFFYYSPQCVFCRTQLKDIINSIDKFKSVQICLISNYSIAELKRFYNEFNLSNFPNIISGRDINGFLIEYFNIEGVPYTAIYDRHKKLSSVYIGKVSSKTLSKKAL